MQILSFLGSMDELGISIFCILEANSSSFLIASWRRLSLKNLMFSIATTIMLVRVCMKFRCLMMGLTLLLLQYHRYDIGNRFTLLITGITISMHSVFYWVRGNEGNILDR